MISWIFTFFIKKQAKNQTRTSDQTVDTFQSNALLAHFEISPGQTTPPEGGTSTTTTSKGLSKPALIGIIVGIICAIAIVGLLFFLIGRSRRKASSEKNAATAPAINVGGTVEPAAQGYGDNPPPGYYGHGQVEGWGGKGLAPPVPPLSPANPQYNPHGSMYGSPPPTNPHASWAPSELGGESASHPERVEIYTPGVDDRVPLNNPPTNP